jgi:translation initiation factor SUI1
MTNLVRRRVNPRPQKSVKYRNPLIVTLLTHMQNKIHIRIQQRNGRKTLTTVSGIPNKFDLKKILKVIKKEFACNGTVVNDEKVGDVIQLQCAYHPPHVSSTR